ncbi:hypothetical protein QWI17_08330 [Gilvimarinus sp. SDUM040013]|uniref:Uncharacterized protein n=1 Tax=Gilvimarinus gilvus TaxID=3058038 RepID=A0ABU4S356_9GAMM|nr:hypothetical protein [Gilvimarinus sp. SDUM040013]MDO3385841.1 hypothetical protein [Gilvimarinus sp. SDUM040013]MDX6851563.1 hypothetical protein [Gilvimarinus sp. SDUM040013]
MKIVRDWLVTLIALVGLLLGILLLLSPIPVGLVVITASLAALLCVNHRSRHLLQMARSRWHKINRTVHKVEKILERRFRKLWTVISSTRPQNDDHSG